MPNIFDLSKISQIVNNQHPAVILVVDTNILMDYPDPSNWNITPAGQTLFILPDAIFHELEFIRQKGESGNKKDSYYRADKAIHIMAELFKKGIITEGIPINAGWIISVPSPKQDVLDQELKQYQDIVNAFKRYDTKLLLLTRECSLLFQLIPVILLTGDVNLFNVAETNGMACHLCNGFPIKDLKIVRQPVNWDSVLGEIQAKAIENSIGVEATLTDYKSAPQWLGAKTLMVAEGYGVMCDGKKSRSFLWTIPFYSQNILSIPKPSKENNPDFPSIYLDFLGEDDIDQNMFDGIAGRLVDCINPSFEQGKPTLQNAESIMEMLIYFEYINREGISEEALEKLRQGIQDSEGLIHYWTDWILNSKNDEDEQIACLEGFMEAIKSCWKIGQTYKFNFMPPK